MHHITVQILARISIRLTNHLATCLGSASEQYQGNQLRLLIANVLSRIKIKRVIPLQGERNTYAYTAKIDADTYITFYIFSYTMQ